MRDPIHIEADSRATLLATVPLHRRIYFIQAGNANAPVKIGIAFNPWQRMDDMQTANANRLRMLGFTPPVPHARRVEEFLHSLFEADRIRREWFKATDRVLDAVDLCSESNISFWRDHEAKAA